MSIQSLIGKFLFLRLDTNGLTQGGHYMLIILLKNP